LLDTKQILEAHQEDAILLALDLQGELRSVNRLETILAPIFCGTPDEQAAFYQYFNSWLEQHPRIQARFKSVKYSPTTPTIQSSGEPATAPTKPIKTWRRRLNLILLTGMLIVISAGLFYPTAFQEPPLIEHTLFGRVIDGIDSSAVIGAEITLAENLVKSDSTGDFKFVDLPADSSLLLTIQQPGYLTKKITIQTQTLPDSQIIVSWKKKGPQKLSGLIKSQRTGEAIAQAQLSFLNQQTSSNAAGQFTFTYLPIDSIGTIFSQHPAYQAASKQIPLHGYYQSNIEILHAEKPSEAMDSLQAVVGRINRLVDRLTPPEPTGFLRFYQLYYSEIRISLAALPLLLALLWFGVRWFQRRILLEKHATTQPHQAESIYVETAADYLFRNATFRHLVQEYRQHREVESPDLDPAETVEATLRNGGLFTPIMATRFILPEYLILIDRTTFNDQHAQFLAEVVKRMVSDGVIVDQYFFDGDPRICRSAEPEAPHLTLQELLVRHPKHRLLIFSDATSFVDARTGQPQRWLDEFESWSSRVIFLPAKTEGAAYLEMLFQTTGFQVCPADPAGLERHIQTLRQSKPPAKTNWEPDRQFPEMLEERLELWLQREPPDEESIADLLENLHNFLEDEGLNWLAACAVYPELHWELTLYLASRLKMDQKSFLNDREQLELQQRLLDLTRLPWFRYGTLPDWLRLRLINQMPPAQHQKVRQVIKTLLQTAQEKRQADTGLELGYIPQTFQDILCHLRELTLNRLNRNQTQKPLTDYVFANYMLGGQSSRLTIRVPDILRRIICKKGNPYLGLRPWILVLFAGLIGWSSWAGLVELKPKRQTMLRIPRFEQVNQETLAELDYPFAASDSNLVQYFFDFLIRQHFFSDTSNLNNLRYFQALIMNPDTSTSRTVHSFLTFIYGTNYLQTDFTNFKRWLSDTLQHEIQFNDSIFVFYAKITEYNWLTQPLFLTFNPAYTPPLPDLKNLDQIDTLTFLQKIARFQQIYTDPNENYWRKRYARSKIDSLTQLQKQSVTIMKPENFLTCVEVNAKNNPIGISHRFQPGNVYAWAKVNAPVSEQLTWKWYSRGQLSSSKPVKITKSSSSGYRVYDFKNYANSAVGIHEVRLYNTSNSLIGRRRFTIETEIPATFDLELSQSVSFDTVTVGGDDFTMILILHNIGPDLARNITLQVTLPAGVKVIDKDFSRKNNLLTWQIDSLVAGRRITRSYKGGLVQAPTQITELQIKGQVTAPGEINPTNNFATSTIYAIPQTEPPTSFKEQQGTSFPKKPAFRDSAKGLSEDDVKLMLKRFDFFDKYWYPKGRGFTNDFVMSADSLFIFDQASGLMWQRGGSDSWLYLKDVQTWIDSINQVGYGGYDDWRLPTLEEAMSLMGPTKNEANRYIDPIFDPKQRRGSQLSLTSEIQVQQPT